MSMQPVKFFLLTGDPGIGKTSLVMKITSFLQDMGVKTCGFYTEEVRRGSTRQGFDIVTLDGVRGRLARDQALLDSPSKHVVGKYGVLVDEFEKISLDSLKTDNKDAVLVIDEIGKMEFFSSRFKERIKEIFGSDKNNIVLATIPIRKGDAIIEGIRNHSCGKVWTISRENRNSVHEEIIKYILDAFVNQQIKVA